MDTNEMDPHSPWQLKVFFLFCFCIIANTKATWQHHWFFFSGLCFPCFHSAFFWAQHFCCLSLYILCAVCYVFWFLQFCFPQLWLLFFQPFARLGQITLAGEARACKGYATYIHTYIHRYASMYIKLGCLWSDSCQLLWWHSYQLCVAHTLLPFCFPPIFFFFF